MEPGRQFDLTPLVFDKHVNVSAPTQRPVRELLAMHAANFGRAAGDSHEQLRHSDANNRLHPERIDDLTESIRQHGMVAPVVVRVAQRGMNRRDEIADGHHRVLAAAQAGMSTVPVVEQRVRPTRNGKKIF